MIQVSNYISLSASCNTMLPPWKGVPSNILLKQYYSRLSVFELSYSWVTLSSPCRILGGPKRTVAVYCTQAGPFPIILWIPDC